VLRHSRAADSLHRRTAGHPAASLKGSSHAEHSTRRLSCWKSAQRLIESQSRGALAGVAPSNFDLELVDIRTLALYKEDLGGPAAPQTWTDFRTRVRAADAVLLVT